jgi:4-alpha-glucanotransferase
VAAGRIEIVGGAFYEPILTMIPPRDRVGQITRYTNGSTTASGPTCRACGCPSGSGSSRSRRDLAEAGIEIHVLDDFHFKNAGLATNNSTATTSPRTTAAAAGRLSRQRAAALHDSLCRSPGDDRLPAASIAERQPGAVVVFGDDGEKFGVWPGHQEHVYDDGWLRRFFDALVGQPRVAARHHAGRGGRPDVPPEGKVYLPDCSAIAK